MTDDRRRAETGDRRAHSRSGRRVSDVHPQKPWYQRRRLWLAAASLVFMGWKRVRTWVHSSRHVPDDGVGA